MEKSLNKKLWVLCGASGVGKSTWINKHSNMFTGSWEIISRDVIRFSLLKEGDEYFSKEDEVWAEFIDWIKTSLERSDNTIVDATHLNAKSRMKLLRALGSSLKNITINAIAFEAPLEWCIHNNNQREGRAYVPLSTLKRLYVCYEEPDYEEGFDNIYIIKTNVSENNIIKKECPYL